MNWEAVSAIGQVAGAVLVGFTLIYLARQLRQNTVAMQSSTFFAISTAMGGTMEVLATHADLVPVMIKAQGGLAALSGEERARFGFVMMMAFRRVEAVVMQRHFGFIDPALTAGFERSAMSVLASPGAREWWEQSKAAFSASFSTWVDARLAGGGEQPIHAALGLGR